MTNLRILSVLTISTQIFLSACDHNIFRSTLEAPPASPEPITILEESSEIASACNGIRGFRLVHGLDHNHDGKLGPYERQHQSIVCNPTTVSNKEGAVAIVPQAQPHLQ